MANQYRVKTGVKLYTQVLEQVKSMIAQGVYKKGDLLPSEKELIEMMGVSRITVRRAVEELCAEGYLVKMQGRGTFVSKPRIHRKFASGRGTASFTETCKEYGMVPGARLLNRQIVPVRKDEEAFFHVGLEALLIYIQRLRTADGQPVFLENLFLPYEPYKSLMSENLNDVSMFDTIERISGLRPATTSCQRIEAVRASAEQAQLLNLSLGEPLLYLNAYFHDQYDHPLCIGRQYYIGSRYMFEF